ncbi:MAG: hypothetical protein WC346_09690 [Methanogenium sp.]|jgi:hypothetical protein
MCRLYDEGFDNHDRWIKDGKRHFAQRLTDAELSRYYADAYYNVITAGVEHLECEAYRAELVIRGVTPQAIIDIESNVRLSLVPCD